ncbi:MAG: T9SS type A sorting domain-containing protein [Chloroherpetonaceae bacterium]|nr:T9SS type A sorting domain-containing protein [Chloroherpetonaceae bacterium]
MKRLSIVFLLSLLIVSSKIHAQVPVIDGNANETAYTSVFNTNSNNGFGSTNAVYSIRTYNDGVNLYLAVTGTLDANNGIAIFMDFSGYGGRAAGSNVGGSLSGGGSFNGPTAANNTNLTLNGMEADYLIWINRDGTNLYLDMIRYGSTNIITRPFIGQTSLSSTSSVTGPSSADTLFMGANTITFAYDNSNTTGATAQGLEMSIPLSALPGVNASQSVKFFAVLGNTGNPTFWSNEAVPGITSASNLGQNPGQLNTGDVFTSELTLPVELSSFNASFKNGTVELVWETASEINNQGFFIERSNDQVAFSNLGFIRGKGTTTEGQRYSFLDRSAAGKVYYRLKQVDFDGKFEYSPILEVSGVPSRFALAQNYPNPFNPSTQINYSLGARSLVTLKVFDILGRELQTLVNETKEIGSYSVRFNASILPSGVYFYRLQSGAFSETKRMMLVK